MVDNTWLKNVIAGKIKVIKSRQKGAVSFRKSMRKEMKHLEKHEADFIQDFLKFQEGYFKSEIRNWRAIKDMIKIIEEEGDEHDERKAKTLVQLDKWLNE